MSADNWAQCPRCKARHQQALKDMRTKFAALYGTVPIEEFEQHRDLLATTEATKLQETLREDYEIYGAEDGVVEVRYACTCKTCGLASEFRYSHTLDV